MRRPWRGFLPKRVVRPDDPHYIGMPESIRGESADEVIRRLAREFATLRPSLAVGGGEAGAHTNGIFNLTAVLALNYLAGALGRKPGQGGVVFNPSPPIEDLPGVSPSASLAQWMGVANDLGSGRVKVLMVPGRQSCAWPPREGRF